MAQTKATSQLTTRAIAPRPSTISEADRSVEFVISSEEKALVFDYERMDVVEEVLLQSGLRMPQNNQVPLLDSHSRASVADILGSLRDVRREGNVTVGRAYFSRKQRSYDCFLDIRDGHVDAISVGYNVTKSTWIPEGQRAVIEGKEYTGPMKISTEWELRESSIVAVGADVKAKVRTAEMPETPEQTPENVNDNGQQAGEKLQEEVQMESENKTPTVPPVQTIDTDAIKAEAVRTERERVMEIRVAAKAAKLDEAATEELIRSGISGDQARKNIIERMAQASQPISQAKVEMVADSSDKFRTAAVDGILIRAGRNIATPAAGAMDFARMNLSRIAEECLRANGINTRGLSTHEIVGQAMNLNSRGAYAIQAGTADFANILLDASNKAMRTEYQEAPRTWSQWCKKGNAANFNTIYRPQLSEASNLDPINEKGEYTEAVFSDKSESFAIGTFGKRYTISRKAIINDSLDAFSRIPQAFGAAAQRLIESLVWGLLINNGNMADGKPIFIDNDHKNLVGGEAFGALAIQRMMTAMMTQKGFGEDTAPLMVQPEFLLVPIALKFAAEIACASASYPVAEYSSNVVNPIRSSGIKVIASPFLDANSAIMSYMAAGGAYSPVEVAFLDGQETPMLEQIQQNDVDGLIYKVRHEVGVCLTDHRFICRHTGS